jgi:hypothetical protein
MTPASAGHALLGAAKNAVASASAHIAHAADRDRDRGAAAANPFATGQHVTTTAPAPGLVAGAWVSIHVHHVRRKGLLAGSTSELRVCIDGNEVLSTTDAPFPKALVAEPALVARLGEGLEGELGPVYLFGEGAGPLPEKLQHELTAAHTGDVAAILPRALSADDGGDSAWRKLWAAFHPGHQIPVPAAPAPPLAGSGAAAAPAATATPRAAPRRDTLSCHCIDTAGATGTALTGHNGVVAFAGTGIRDTLASLGGLSALIPLFGSSLASAMRRARRSASHQQPQHQRRYERRRL